MLKKIIIKLKTKEDIYPQYNWGYDLYGALMEKLSPEYATRLHDAGLKPVNQYLLIPIKANIGEKLSTWVINILGEEAIKEIIPLITTINEIKLRHYETIMQVEDIKIEKTISEYDFVERYLLKEKGKGNYKVNFLTPTSFRTNNQYAMFPSAELIIKSAVQKWNSYAKETIIDDAYALDDLINHSRITSYSLKSSYYKLKGTKIPSFIGYANLEIKGPQPMVKLYDMLINFLLYSGLGIKSSLGMGGCNIE